VGTVRRGLRAAAAARREARFRAWSARLDFELRRRGARLVLDADEAPAFETAPSITWIAHALSAPRRGGPPVLTLRLGRNVDLGRGLTLELRPDGTNLLELGDDVHLQDSVRLVLADGRISVGDRGRLRAGVILKSSGDLLLGEQVLLSYRDVVHCVERIELHDLVSVAEHVTIIDSNHTLDGSDTYIFEQPVAASPVTLERNVLIGAGAVLLPGAHLGPNVQVGALALVTRGDHPGGWLVAGSPAVPVRPLERRGVAAAA
jgi:acetyltransferase-like isoleucine patch superfamily enzyme